MAPVAPNALTPARRGAPSSLAHAASSVWSRNGESARSRYGLARSAGTSGVSVRWWSWSTALVSALIPAADSACPIADLTEPSAQKPVRSVRALKARSRASTSIRSPISVPVPCASTYPSDAGSTPARSRQSATTACCAVADGTRKPGVRPEWLTALPLITAYTASPSSTARLSGLSSTAPTPSADT